MHLVASGDQFSSTGAMSGSIYGQPCATNAFSVAAIPFVSMTTPVGFSWNPMSMGALYLSFCVRCCCEVMTSTNWRVGKLSVV